MTNPRTPILIGVGQVTEKDPPIEEASSPLDLIEQATILALEDAGISRENLSDLTLETNRLIGEMIRKQEKQITATEDLSGSYTG